MKKIALVLSLSLIAAMMITTVVTVECDSEKTSLKKPDLKPTRDNDPEEGVFLSNVIWALDERI